MHFLNDFAAGLSGTVWGWPEVFPGLVALLLVTALFVLLVRFGGSGSGSGSSS